MAQGHCHSFPRSDIGFQSESLMRTRLDRAEMSEHYTYEFHRFEFNHGHLADETVPNAEPCAKLHTIFTSWARAAVTCESPVHLNRAAFDDPDGARLSRSCSEVHFLPCGE
jgi:hypothetical protein